MFHNSFENCRLDSFDVCLNTMDGQNVDGNSSAINISDVIEVIETDTAFGSMEPRRPSFEGGSGPYIKILEQPASKALRFRYECEGRSAGSIPGISSIPENKTFPTIQVMNYKGRAIVVVSCVTKDPPFKPHPHNLVGKEACKKGVCTVEINNDNMIASFANLGIQCVKKKDIEDALKVRESIRVDPFKTGFAHKTQASSIDLNSVRLAFQVFLEGPRVGKFTQPIQPVVSEPIYDKKAMADLVICKLSHCSASVAGGAEVILLCEKVAKEDISVRFFEEKDGQIIWEGFGDFTPAQVHKQVAIYFRTPRYKTLEIDAAVQVSIQLRRPSDNATSEALPFLITPLDSGRPHFWSLQRTLGQKANYRTFANILQTNKQMSKPHSPVEQDKQVSSSGHFLDNQSSPMPEPLTQDTNNNKASPIKVADIPQPKVLVLPDESELEADGSIVIKPEADMDKEFNELFEEVTNLDIYPVNNNPNDLGDYTSLQLAMKNPCEILEFNQSYEDVIPPRPSAPKPQLSPIPVQEEELDFEEVMPPLPPKRAKKGPEGKALPAIPEKTKMNIFQKLFSSKRKKKSMNGSIGSRGSSRSLASNVPIEDKGELLTEAEHYALYTSVAPHATASEFDEMSFYYSAVEPKKVE